jgi:hypothetical protein
MDNVALVTEILLCIGRAELWEEACFQSKRLANYKSPKPLLGTSHEFESGTVNAIIVVFCHQAGLVMR